MNDASLVRADCRAYGIVNAPGAPQRVKPRTRTIALTDCISYNPRNGETVDTGTVFAPIRTRHASHKRKRTTSAASKHAITEALLMSLPTIHDVG